MATFWTRVELHKAGVAIPASEYTALHKAMATIGFQRATSGFKNPPAEYTGTSQGAFVILQTMRIPSAIKTALTSGQSFQFLLAEVSRIESGQGTK